jgi:hypothetical protein
VFTAPSFSNGKTSQLQKKKEEDPAATFAAAGGGRDDVFAIAAERLRHSVTLPFRHVQMVISAVLTRAGPPIRVLKAIV